MTESTVYLVRHGRTVFNAEGRLRGRLDVPLDDVGRREAAALSGLFAPVGLTAVVASPLSRAVDTARAIADNHGLAVQVDEGLADRDWGSWAGVAEAEVLGRFGSLDAAPGVEAVDAFGARVHAAVERAADKARGGRVVVVAHDAVNRTLLASVVAGPLSQHTGCWNRLVREDDRWMAPVVDALPGDGQQP